MLDFEVQRCTRRCSATDRELQPGESFYSVLVPSGGAVNRLDFSEGAWTGPPEHSIGWWKSQVPDLNAKKLQWAPHDVMLHFFEQLQADPAQQDLQYVLALLMIRRRLLRLEQTESEPDGQEYLLVYCPRNESDYRVPVVAPTPERAVQIQQELVRLLFAHAG